MEGTDPVNKKLVAALSGGVALLMALSGCSGVDGAVEDYAKKVCEEIPPQSQKRDSSNQVIRDAASDSSPEDVKEADSAAFQQISEAYAAMSDSLKQAGPPPVDKGKEIHREAVAKLAATSAAYADLKASVDGLNTDDRAEFAEGLNGVVEQLHEVNGIEEGALRKLRKLQSGEVGAAMAKQPGCRRPGASSSPTAAS
jgi:hypothetical protein